MIRSDSAMASSIECVTSTTVLPVRAEDVLELLLQHLAGHRVEGAERLVEQQDLRGSVTSARARPTRWRMPPDSSYE